MNKLKLKSKATGLCRTRPCMIISTLNPGGVPNAGTFGAYTNVGPEEIAIAIGRNSHTYANIKREDEFVINIPGIAYAQALEDCARRIPINEDEIAAAGLTAAYADMVKAPLIAECVANIECKFWKEMEIGHHILVVGKVLCGHLAEEFADADGGIDVVKAKVPFGINYPSPVYAVLGETTTVAKR